MTDRRFIEVRGFKWPRRPTGITRATLLGADTYGRWIGVKKGDPWWSAEGSHNGTFIGSLVKVVPHDSFWTACFYPGDPVIDVDIVLPVRWDGDVLEEIDLELDILRSAAGEVWVRDREEFKRVCEEGALPETIVARALATCEEVRARVTAGTEPFGAVGQQWLTRFMARTGMIA